MQSYGLNSKSDIYIYIYIYKLNKSFKKDQVGN